MNLWQDDFTLQQDKLYCLCLRALEVYLEYQACEWQIHYRYRFDNDETVDTALSFQPVSELPDSGLTSTRIMHSTVSNVLQFRPTLANRPIVAKPHTPLWIPSNEAVTIFASTPIWLAILQPESSQPLMTIPSFILSDTWFGSKPHVGELAYASRFSGRTQLESLPRRSSRIITPLKIINHSDEHIKLDKTPIPTDVLSVHLSQRELWTPGITAIKENDEKMTQISVDETLHPSLKQTTRIVEPREADSNTLLSKTFGRLFK